MGMCAGTFCMRIYHFYFMHETVCVRGHADMKRYPHNAVVKDIVFR